jgi:hypothetical protein
MLHVVQEVMWGVAETPQLFLDEAKAQAAFVECARKRWAQRYAAYCEHHGLSGDSFVAAQAFVNTIDVSEKSTINYWTFAPAAVGLGDATSPPCGPGPEEFRQIAEGLVAVRERLTQLLDDVSALTDRCARMDVSPVGAETGGGPEKPALCSPAMAEERPEAAPETYTTPEWKTFVGTIKRLCSGSSNQSDLLPRDDWRQDVYSSRTALEYWDWVADRFKKYKEMAQDANYSVSEDPAAPGYYRFTNQQGSASKDRYDSEWEAWCAAGLHLEEGITGA